MYTVNRGNFGENCPKGRLITSMFGYLLPVTSTRDRHTVFAHTKVAYQQKILKVGEITKHSSSVCDR